MKKILLYIIAMSSFLANAQSFSYTDIAVLFSTDDDYGTARYMGLSGAFGALGGDMSAVNTNPAGLAVFNKPEISMTLGLRNTEYNTNFYGTTANNIDNYFKLSQIGGVFFLRSYGNSNLKKIMFGVNYSIVKDFNSGYTAKGNSEIGDFIDDPFLNYDNNNTNDINYINVENQFFGNFTSGINDQFTFSIASQYGDLFYIGASMSFQHINFRQNTIFDESNNDGNGNTLDAYSSQYLSVYGNGFNFGLGAIVKPIQNLRLGVSFQSPNWYNLSEEFDQDLEIEVSNNSQTYIEDYDVNQFDYEVKTSGKLTGSIAYVFEKIGLISLDYIYQGYKSTKLKPQNIFINENQELATNLNNTSSIKLGTEWRYNSLSFRGGYKITQSPYTNSDSSFDIKGYSLGLGIKFSNRINLDFAYDNSSQQDQYQFLNLNGVEPANLDINNDRFSSTLTINF